MICNRILLRYLIRSNALVFKCSVITNKKYNGLAYLIPTLEETNRLFHTSQQFFDDTNTRKSYAVIKYMFENAKDKKKDAFLEIIHTYEKENNRRGHVEFIKLAMKYLKLYGLHRDLEVYKAILNVFPKGPYIAPNYYTAVFRYYPKHQDTATDVLEEMENNQIMPDRELEIILLNTFGKHAKPLKKLWRMMYWMPKFKNVNPWPVPKPIPTDPRILARLAIEKISSIDVTSFISEFETIDLKDSIEDTWIISAISRIQKDLLMEHSKLRKGIAIYVEGPFKIWVADQSVDYFVLKADPIKRTIKYQDPDDVRNISIPFWKTREIAVEPTVHDQEDGVYFAVGATGTSSKDSALSWIRFLQKDNPILKEIPILIKLASTVETESITYVEQNNLQKKVITD